MGIPSLSFSLYESFLDFQPFHGFHSVEKDNRIFIIGFSSVYVYVRIEEEIILQNRFFFFKRNLKKKKRKQREKNMHESLRRNFRRKDFDPRLPC